MAATGRGAIRFPSAKPADVSDPARETFKRQAAERAVQFVRSGMTVGLGTGSTAIHATRRIAALLHQGVLHDIVGFATSHAVAEEAARLGVPMLDEAMPRDLDLTIDGADEIDPKLNLIKGGGGALLREKIAAQASRRLVIVADESKLSPRLGTRFVVPVEVLAFGWRSQARFLAALGAEVMPRVGLRTDQGNMILDCRFGPIADAVALAGRIEGRAGVVAHGLFLGLASLAVIAGPVGVQVMRARRDRTV